MTERIRILIADDHAVVRHGLRALIATEPDLELVGEAADGVEAVELTARLQSRRDPDGYGDAAQDRSGSDLRHQAR